MSAPDIQLTIVSDPAFLGVVRNVVRSYLEACGFGAERTQEIVLAVDEVCANAIRHAYKGESDHEYTLSMRRTEGFVEVRVTDDGIPGAARSQETEKSAPSTLDDATIGGYGTQIVRMVCDEVSFESGKPEGNCVTVKVRQPA